ncbi:MAG: hypothetical protein ISS16_01510 [Ignavibacteria bacterium]|nr:hypothetical protein [Ignavibacteria bacterium]
MMIRIHSKTIYLLLFFLSLLVGCTSSKYEKEEEIEEEEVIIPVEGQGALIIQTAAVEQQNEMYSPKKDSVYLYWLDNQLLVIKNSTKCNIFALNTLFKAGFKTPTVNALTRDLMDKTKFTDVLPIINISDPEEIIKGDLIAWYGHVIIFDYLVKKKNKIYAQAWWSGTSQEDNNDNVINNVKYGKYPLKGNYIVRRPIKK